MAAKKRTASRTKPAARRRTTRRVTRTTPESLRLRKLTAALTVNQIGRSLQWYRDVLGFVEEDRWEDAGQLRGVLIKAGSVTLMLSQDDFAKGRDRQKGVGFRLRADTVQDLDAIADRIRSRGGTLTQEPADMPWGERILSVTDPDGFQITVVQA